MTYLERHDDDANVHRFYVLDIVRDLFGQLILIRRFGRVGAGSRSGAGSGREIHQCFDSRSEAGVALAAIVQQKQRRGYLPV